MSSILTVHAKRVSYAILITLVASCLWTCMHAAARSAPNAIYFVAATPPQNGAPRWYSAALYTVGEEQRLHLIRQFFAANQYFMDFADDLNGKIYVAGQNSLFVLHEDDPTRTDYVPLEKFDDFPCWGAVRGNAAPSAVQYCYADQIIQVLGNVEPGKPRVGSGNWAKFRFLQYGGENGGPFQMMPPLAEIDDANLVMPYSFRPDVVLAQLPPELSAKPELRRLVWILASTDRYLVIWILPAHMVGGSVDSSNPRHAEPLQVLVLQRLNNHWRTLELPTAVTSLTLAPIRIFGDWLVTTMMNWRPGPLGSGSGSPGIENETFGSPNATFTSAGQLPDVRDEYYNQFRDLYIPGKMLIQNLADDRKLTLDTGQEDSEVVAIRSDGEILYRVNDSVYSAKIVGDQIVEPTLIVKDADVPEIHWAFWGPATKSANSR